MNNERNLLLGNGERMTQTTPFGNSGGPKKYPYSIEEVRETLHTSLQSVKINLQELPELAKPRGEAVFKLTLHPAFLGKSYFPDDLLRESGLRDVGSKQVTIKPRKITRSHDKEKLLATAQIFVAGNNAALDNFDRLLTSQSTPKILQKQFTEIEAIGWINSEDRLKGDIPKTSDFFQFEVVLHAGPDEDDILRAFSLFAKSLNISIDLGRRIQVGSLTFLPINSTGHALRKLSQFNFLRVARLMPELRAIDTGIIRQALEVDIPELPIEGPLFTDTRAAIFDGGLGTEDLNIWATEFKNQDTEKTTGQLLQHGNEVTSTFLFGRIDPSSPVFPRPFMGVDHYRVLSKDTGHDIDLFDVLQKIRSILDTGKYQFANLSLGPRLPIDDGEVHVWTAVLDQICARHKILTTVAVGNDGAEEGDARRIQPPADMVNSLSVGAADRSGITWARAPYSCVGPGRSPGLVKPDGLAFGGSEKEAFCTFNPLLGRIVSVAGTSYASPLTLRTAAGAFALTDYPLSTVALKALMIHHTEPAKGSREEFGWGRFSEDPYTLLDCGSDAVSIIYQGQLAKGEYLRAHIPFPNIAFTGRVELKATICFLAPTDPEHVINYTRSGIQVSFRPRFGLNDENTSDFFNHASQYQTEQEIRSDGHKWETCLHRSKRFNANTEISDPIFDIRYHARATSKNIPAKSAPDIEYAMIVTLRIEDMPDIYNIIRQRYQILQPVPLRVGIELPAN